MNRPTHLIVHCSDSPYGDAALIEKWHTDPVDKGGRGWSAIGYHFVILNGRRQSSKLYDPAADGVIESGRPENAVGSHCVGFNARSLGICLVGTTVFTSHQMNNLRALLLEMMRKYGIPVANVLGHKETPDTKKTCPNLDMELLRRELAAKNPLTQS